MKPKTAAMSPEEREAKEAARHAPVSLPSGGSFDREDLQKGLERVVDRQPANRDAEVQKALESAQTDAPRTETSSPNQLPAHKMVDADVQLAPGTQVGTGKNETMVGEVVVKERRQVFDADAGQDEVSAASGGQPVTGNRSEILSVADAEGPPPEAVSEAAPVDSGHE